MSDITIGTAPVNWNNQDVPGYRPPTPYTQMLAEMAAAGYEATEFDDTFPDDPQQAMRDLSAHGLAPASTFCAVNLRDELRWEGQIARAEERAQYVAALGGDILIVADSGDDRRRSLAGHVSPDQGLDAAAWQLLTSGLSKVSRRCARHGVRIAFHNHVGTYVETEEEVRHLLDMTDPGEVGLCYDLGHMLYGGGDVMRVLDRYGDRIRYVHLKDVDLAVLERSRREHLGFADALLLGIFTEFGTGSMDFGRFFQALDAVDYSGWIIVEQDTTKTTPYESAKANREYLRRSFGL